MDPKPCLFSGELLKPDFETRKKHHFKWVKKF